MEKTPDWLTLWRQLVEVQNKYHDRKKTDRKGKDFWKDKACHFQKMVKKRWERPDVSRDFIIARLKENPRSTVLDIGAGTGAWTVMMAPFAAKITAVEPSDSMRDLMAENVKNQGITNVDIIDGNWPDVSIAPHDFVFASHSMYGVLDFKAFVEKMNQTALKTCILLLRLPYADAVMARAATRVLGQPFDSPNFQVAYNALLQLDIFPNVLVEGVGGWEPWSHDSLEAALDEIKNRFGLQEDPAHDAFLKNLLEESLHLENGEYVWPAGTRSALAYWDVS